MAVASLKVITVFSAIDKLSGTFDKLGSKSASIASKINSAGNSLSIMGGAITSSIGLAVNQAVKYEDQMANIRKVFRGTQQDFNSFDKGLLEFSKTTRTSIPDLQESAIELSKMGIEGKDLINVLSQYDKINLALGDNFSGGARQAAKEVSRLTFLFRDLTKMDKVQASLKVGNILNELVQRMPVVEAENTVEFVNRIVGANPDIVPNVDSAMALGATLTALGMNPEAAASGTQRAYRTILNNASTFAKQMGITTKELEESMKVDSAKFLLELGASFGDLGPVRMAEKMKELGLNLIYSEQVLNRMKAEGGATFFAEALETAAKASDNLNSINKEAAIVNTTSAAQMLQFKNALITFSIEAGNQLLPALKELLPVLKVLLEDFSGVVKENPGLVPFLVKLGMTMMVLGSIFKFVASVVSSWGVITTVVSAIFSLIGLLVALVALLAYTIYKATQNWDTWGAAVLQFLGPIGWVVNAIMSIREHFDGIVSAFKNGGLVAGFIKLGIVLLDSVLKPLEQIFSYLSKVPVIGKFFESASEGVRNTRDYLNLTSAQEKVTQKRTERLPSYSIDPDSFFGNKKDYNSDPMRFLNINIKDKGDNVEKVETKGIPVTLNSTKLI